MGNPFLEEKRMCTSPQSLSTWTLSKCPSVLNKNPSYVGAMFNSVFADGIGQNPELEYAVGDFCGSDLSKGTCLNPLLQLCSTLTREDLLADPLKRYLCGCYLSGTQYLAVNRTCDSLCSSVSSVPYVDTKGRQTCNADICVIDNVTINTQNATLGKISFEQTCNTCAPGKECICVLSDINLLVKNSRFAGISVDQNCAFTSCIDSNGRSVDCSLYLSTMGYSDTEIEELNTKTDQGFVFFGLLIPICLILYFIVYLVEKRQSRT